MYILTFRQSSSKNFEEGLARARGLGGHWDGEKMQVEPGMPEKSLQALQKHWPTNIWSTIDVYFCGVHTVIPNIDGGGDPRRGGSVREIDDLKN